MRWKYNEFLTMTWASSASYLCCASASRPWSWWSRRLRPRCTKARPRCTSSPSPAARTLARGTRCRAGKWPPRADPRAWRGHTPRGPLGTERRKQRRLSVDRSNARNANKNRTETWDLQEFSRFASVSANRVFKSVFHRRSLQLNQIKSAPKR